MTVESLAAWILMAMTAWSPVSKGAKEGIITQQYAGIARDLATVALDPDELPLFEEGEQSREKTALLLAAIASYESGFRHDVDVGKTRGDNGRSWCLMQVKVFGKTAEGWTGKQLVEDRTRCFRAGLHLTRQSFAMCKHLPTYDKLSGYTTGSCRSGNGASYARMVRAMTWWQKHKPEETSQERWLVEVSRAIPSKDHGASDVIEPEP